MRQQTQAGGCRQFRRGSRPGATPGPKRRSRVGFGGAPIPPASLLGGTLAVGSPTRSAGAASTHTRLDPEVPSRYVVARLWRTGVPPTSVSHVHLQGGELNQRDCFHMHKQPVPRALRRRSGDTLGAAQWYSPLRRRVREIAWSRPLSRSPRGCRRSSGCRLDNADSLQACPGCRRRIA